MSVNTKVTIPVGSSVAGELIGPVSHTGRTRVRPGVPRGPAIGVPTLISRGPRPRFDSSDVMSPEDGHRRVRDLGDLHRSTGPRTQDRVNWSISSFAYPSRQASGPPVATHGTILVSIQTTSNQRLVPRKADLVPSMSGSFDSGPLSPIDIGPQEMPARGAFGFATKD